MTKHPFQTGRRRLALAAAALALLIPLTASAATEQLVVDVTRTLAATGDEGEDWGGCMAQLSREPVDVGLDCPLDNAWVSFDCTGASRSNAARMFDSAQMAFVTDRRIRIWVTDEIKRTGHCVAVRVDVLGG